jgi:hypothetical protein
MSSDQPNPLNYMARSDDECARVGAQRLVALGKELAEIMLEGMRDALERRGWLGRGRGWPWLAYHTAGNVSDGEWESVVARAKQRQVGQEASAKTAR